MPIPFAGPIAGTPAGDLDAIDLQLLWGRVVAIADQMATTLTRTSYSTLVREGNDFACVLMDEHGRAIAQSGQSIPSFTVLLPRAAKKILERFPADEWRPGDAVVTNDPWLANGHLPDLTMVVPVFIDERLVGFTGTVAHLPDIGGQQLSGSAREIYEEGLRIPPVRLYRHGELDPVVSALLEANVRVPAQVLGDVQAQFLTNQFGARRYAHLLKDGGVHTGAQLSAPILRRTHDAFIARLATVTPGTYRATVEGDGYDEPVTVSVAVHISPTGIHVDFAGSSAATRRGNNVPLSYSRAYAIYALKCVLDPDTPNNEGFFELVTVEAPPDTVINASPPRAVAARHTVGHLVPSAIFRALSAEGSLDVPAETGTPLWAFCFTGDRDGVPFSVFPSFNGGQGASDGRAGLPCLSFPSNSSNTPIEVIEALTSLEVIEKSLIDGSGGSGANAGGAGQRVSMRVKGVSPVRVTMFSDKIATKAFGLHGGGPGRSGAVTVNGQPVAEAKGEMTLVPGDVITLDLPGGGGWGQATDPAATVVLP